MPKDAGAIWMKSLMRRLAEAKVKARRLVSQDCYAEAEQLICKINSDVYGAIAVGETYTEELKSMVASGNHKTNTPRAEELFGRALKWMQSAYPDPHTRIEADDFSRGRDEDLAALVKILGYDPAKR